MFRIVIVGHAGFPNGLVSAATVISGEHPCLLGLELSPEDGPDILLAKMEAVLDERQTLILCDMVGGSPWRVATDLMRGHPGAMLSGANLPMVLELLACSGADVSLDEAVERARSAAVKGIQ